MENSKIEDLKRKIAQLEKELQETKGEIDKKQKVEKTSFTPTKTIYSWKALARTYVKRSKVWFLTVAAVALLLIILAAFLQDIMLILVICVVVLITFLLSSIPPQNVKHEILNKGIKSIGTLYKWENLKDFCVAEKLGQKVLYVRTKLKIPTRLVLLLNNEKEEKTVVKLIGQHLDYSEYREKQGWLSRISDGVIVNPSKYETLFKNSKPEK